MISVKPEKISSFYHTSTSLRETLDRFLATGSEVWMLTKRGEPWCLLAPAGMAAQLPALSEVVSVTTFSANTTPLLDRVREGTPLGLTRGGRLDGIFLPLESMQLLGPHRVLRPAA